MNEKGKLIVVWSFGLHGAGATTLALATSFLLDRLTNKRILLANFSGGLSYLEKYVESDVLVERTLNDLEVFKDTHITDEHIKAYVTPVNNELFIIGGEKFKFREPDYEFRMSCLDRFLETFDIVIADIDTNIRPENKLYIDKADSILAVLTMNKVMLNDVLETNKGIEEVLKDTRTTIVLNKIFPGQKLMKDDKFSELIEKYKSKDLYRVHIDEGITNYCCNESKCFTYLNKVREDSKNEFIDDVVELTLSVLNKLEIPYKIDKKQSFIQRLFKI